MPTKLDLYQRVVPLAGLGIWERNFETGEFYWNKVIREILEIADDFTTTLEHSLQFYRKPELIRQLIDQAILSGSYEVAELELITARSNLKWVRVRVQAECQYGRCLKIYGTLEDITENVRLMNTLVEREVRFSNAFDYAPIGMALVSLNGGWIKVNQSLCKLLGYQEDEFLQHTFQDFTHPDDLESDLSQLNQLLAGDIESYSMEKRYFHAEGRTIYALLNVSLVRDEAENPLYFVSQIKDISDRRRSMEIIKEQNNRLLNFAHIVSHNLRSHTGNIRMLTDMILSENDEEERANLTQMLHVNADNLLETLEHLNEVVKVQDNGQSGRVFLNLNNEIHRVINILSGSIRQSGAVVNLEIKTDITVEFSPAYLESILMNLITNSLKYKHPDRAPEINISATKKNGSVSLQVKDNGLGIDMALYGSKLFGMYKTFHKHPDARGMGLFLVKNQVEAMGGSITAESQPGVGTTFLIEFD
ncbi:sensor histidine kinase [Mucilaginibacter jinjuensis]|uniref:histidine kinase n=1 Tax=Mucilaginibacter jinjuensis TaxID=1176721 RepID=A0ABY7TAL7_9SPHI|nr:sensor histidine kinase [Mucilaginibacter jinjuensis]WCT13376.1 PAS domain S-box protein [Mucilaginibacter jinjuensis]